jgi:F0F1-type ATP synthase assembly protein I
MPSRKTLGALGKTLEALQSNMQQAGPAATASYTLIGGIILLGGFGYLIDYWCGSAPWGLLIGLFLGVAVGFYQLIKTVWRP